MTHNIESPWSLRQHISIFADPDRLPSSAGFAQPARFIEFADDAAELGGSRHRSGPGTGSAPIRVLQARHFIPNNCGLKARPMKDLLFKLKALSTVANLVNRLSAFPAFFRMADVIRIAALSRATV